MNAHINDLKSKSTEVVENLLKNLDSENGSDIDPGSLILDHYHQLEVNFPRCLNYSFVTMIYTTLEARINELCNDLINKRNLNLTIEHLKGSFAERVGLFFSAFNLKGLKKRI